MRDFFSILSQLGWGLTVGALTAAFASLAQMAAIAVCVLTGGCSFWWWRRRRSRASLSAREDGPGA